MFWLIALVIAAIMLVITLVNVIMGIVRGLKKSIASLISVVVSAIISAIITVMLCMPSLPFIQWLMGLMVDALASVDPSIVEMIATESVFVAISYYASMLIAPFVFTLLFAIVSIIVSIIVAIIMSIIAKKNKKRPNALSRLSGAAVGLICGLLVSVLCVFPVVGICDIAEGVVGSVYDDLMKIDVVKESIEELPFEVNATPGAMKVFDYVGCGLLYDAFSVTYFEGERVSLEEDVYVLMDVGSELMSADTESEGLNSSHVDMIKAIISALDRSPLIKNIIAEVIVTATDEENGFLDGIDMGELMSPVVDEMISVMSTSTKDTLTDDLTTLANVLGIIIDSEILDDTDSQAMLTKLGDGLVSDLLVEINKNERMRPVADEITQLSIRALASTLGIPADSDERYDVLMDKIAEALNDTRGQDEASRLDNVSQKLDTLFADYGIAVNGDALGHVAQGLIADLGDGATGDSVKEFFMIYHFAADESGESAEADSGVEYLSSSNSEGIVVNGDGTVSIGDIVLKHYNANNYRSSNAYTMGVQHVDIGAADAFYSATTIKSTVLTAEDILASLGNYGDCSDAIAEAQKVGDIFATMSAIISDKDLDDLDTTEIFAELGQVFDMMKDSEIFKSDSAKNLLTAILQSEKIIGAMGLSQKDMTEFANKINSYAGERENGYEDATKAISGTLNAVNKASDKDATTEEKVAATKDMIDNVNKDNAEMISSMVSGDMIGDYGVAVDNSASVSDALKNMVHNMADYKEGNPADEDVDKEAEAVTKMLNLAMVGSGEGPMFDTEDGEKGSVASDPDSFISTVVESDVVMKTIGQSVEGKEAGSNPYGVTYNTEAEKETVASSLEKYYEENGGGEELAERLTNLAIAMDVEVNFEYPNDAE